MTKSNSLRVLHTVERYLPTTENWVFRLLSNIPDIEVAVASKTFIPCDFYPSHFRFLRFPLSIIPPPRRTLVTRLNNFIADRALRAYPWWAAQKAGPADLVHSHFAPCAWTYRPTASLLGVPHVVSFYGYDYENLPFREPVWLERYRELFKSADLFICEGRHGAVTLERMGCPPGKIRVVKLGLDPERVPYISRRKKPGQLNLVQIASLVPKKGHLDTVRAFVKALQSCPNMTLTLVGREPGSSGGRITREIDKVLTEATRSRVRRLDAIDFSRLYEFMTEFDAFIHPSRYSEERDCEGGAPVVLLDAQATGLPIISTTHCDIPEEVVHGRTGLLTPESDVEALTASIETFYKMSEDTYSMFARQAREHVVSEYDIATNARQLLVEYQRVLLGFSDGSTN